MRLENRKNLEKIIKFFFMPIGGSTKLPVKNTLRIKTPSSGKGWQ
jgi:hypothetical protein